MSRATHALLGALALVLALPAVAASAADATLKDLQKRQVRGPQGRAVGRAMPARRWTITVASSTAEHRSGAARRGAAPAGRPEPGVRRTGAPGNEVTRVDLGGAEAIRLYTMLLKAYPDYPRNDQVLYQLARAYETTGQPEQGAGHAGRHRQPLSASREIGEVQFRRGELLFSAKRYVDARGGLRRRSSRRGAGRRSTSRASTSMAGRCSSRA